MHRDSTGERLRALSRALHDHRPRLGAGDFDRASVALVVRPDGDDFDLLLIKRATRADDPWSGQMALPGGRSGPADADARATAERETWEEVGIDLRARGTLLGRLDDVQPRPDAPQILVAAFVFQVPPRTEAVWNYEVDTAVWIPLAQLAAPGAATEYLHPASSGEELRFPALICQGHVVWGITFRIITQLLALVEGS